MKQDMLNIHLLHFTSQAHFGVAILGICFCLGLGLGRVWWRSRSRGSGLVNIPFVST